MTKAQALSERLRGDETLTMTELADRSGVILSLHHRTVLSLNETGQFLVNLLRRGIADEEELVRRLTQEFEVDAATARKDMEAFLAALAKSLHL